MGKATLVRKDLNRLAKIYPFVIRTPKYAYISDTSLVLESAIVDFAGGNTATYIFKNTYASVPIVVATPLNDSFNVSISSVTRSSVTVTASVANSDSASLVIVETA